MNAKQLRDLIFHLSDDEIVRVQDMSGDHLEIVGIGSDTDPDQNYLVYSVLRLQHVAEKGEDS